MFRELEERQDVFTGIAGHHGPFEANLSSGDFPRRGTGMLVSGSYFSVLNLQPAIGRLIDPRDEPRIGESAVVVLSYAFWATRFGGDRNIVGRTLIVNDFPLTIVGVAPGGFSGTMVGARPDFFVPLTLREQMQPEAMRFQRFEDPFAHWMYAFARLRPGVTLGQAADRLVALHAGIVDELESSPASATPPQASPDRGIALEPGARGQSPIAGKVAPTLRLLLALTVLVMLIVCINVASLLLARGASRSGELAIRASLRAERRRIASQLLTETALPAIIGVLLALPVAAAVLRVVVSALPL
jgi:hypothetical protein